MGIVRIGGDLASDLQRGNRIVNRHRQIGFGIERAGENRLPAARAEIRVW